MLKKKETLKMRILLINPIARFNYKAPFNPLGLLSIATVLKQNGYTVKFINRCFDNTNIKTVLDEFNPEICGISIIGTKSINDSLIISKAIKERNIPIVWGGGVPSAYYKESLKTGLCDYISIGEGEYTWLELVSALENGRDISTVKGLAYLDKKGEIVKTEDRPLANLADLPVIDWTLDDPKHYLHPYLCCKKMMYLYSSKGCPGNCTFCSCPSLHQHKYRKRPPENVLQEIAYLQQNYGLDGVYFSDECWCVRKSDVHDFCEKIKASNMTFYWGCEIRIGILDKEEFQLMYDCGCRWIFFGIETGSPEMLCNIKKGITVEQIKQDVQFCNEMGITAIASYIIGYPDETFEQISDTIKLIKELHAGVTAINIYTPIIGSELYDKLVAEGKYTPPKDILELKKIIFAEHSDYRCSNIPILDLKVIRGYYLWKGFTKKTTSKNGKSFEVAKSAVVDAFHNLTKLGFGGLIPGMAIIAKEFFVVFWYANFYPRIRKKYNL